MSLWALSLIVISRLLKRLYLCWPIGLPSPAGILTRSRASDIKVEDLSSSAFSIRHPLCMPDFEGYH